MPKVIGVRFKPVTKVYFFDPSSLTDLQYNDRVIVETSRGTEMGTVVQPPYDVPESEIKGKLKKVIRQATSVDLLEAMSHQAQVDEALDHCQKLIQELNLPMKVLEAEYSFDGSRLIFSFIAEQRIDFRELVKELTRSLKTRVEMKQVGARDETKILDGYGRCGRRLCCSSWLTEFHSVSIKMAKNQNLPLAPSEISGLCGRLLCCLAYENELYVEMRQTMPKVGSQLTVEPGVIGIVRGLNVINESVLVELEGRDGYLEVKLSELPAQADAAPKSAKPDSKKK